MYDEKTIAQAVQKALQQLQEEKTEITIGVSQRHVHLSQQDLETLFGKGFQLTKQKTLMGREYASEQFVT